MEVQLRNGEVAVEVEVRLKVQWGYSGGRVEVRCGRGRGRVELQLRCGRGRVELQLRCGANPEGVQHP